MTHPKRERGMAYDNRQQFMWTTCDVYFLFVEGCFCMLSEFCGATREVH